MENKKTLGEYVKENSTFITIGDGEEYTGIYRGYKFIEKDYMGETNEYVRYMFEDPTDKVLRGFDSRSGALARQFEEIVEGTLVTISRVGEQRETKYTVKEVKPQE